MKIKKRRLGSLLLSVVMLLNLFPMTVTAAGEEWVQIYNAADLEDIADNPSGNYHLARDIDLAGVEWSPIDSFTGKLDGNDKIISNFTISDTTTSNNGLFSSVGAAGRISNLGIEDASITAGDNAGILAGENNGTISQCYTKGSVSGYQYVGGLVGKNAGTIEDSFSRAEVSGKDYLGGLAGSSSGTVTYSYAASSLLASVFNNYLDFDGSTGYIDIPHRDSYVGDEFTLEAWFQWDNTGTDEPEFIIGKGYEQFEIHTGGGSGINGIRFIPIWNEAGDSWIDVKNVIQPGWFHVAAVYSYDSTEGQATARVYVNGESQDLWRGTTNLGKEAYLTRPTNTLGWGNVSGVMVPQENNINIGRRTDNMYYFDGKICDVRFWNIARVGEEIKRDKDKVLNGDETGLVGYWKLDEGTGDAIDSSSGNDGTLIGGVLRTTETAGSHKGGLIGDNTGSVSGSYYDSEVSGQSDAVGIPQTTEQLMLQTSYTDWDFSDIWAIDSAENDGYPFLRSKIKSAFLLGLSVPETGGTPLSTAIAEGLIHDPDFTITDLTWNEAFTAENYFKADQIYTASFTLTSKNGREFQAEPFTPVVIGAASVGTTVTSGEGVGNTVTFTATYPVTAARAVQSIEIKTQPIKMIYLEDTDALSLAGMVVKETYNDKTTETVCFTDGTAEGYTTSLANGTILTRANNKAVVTVTYTATARMTNTNNLVVGLEAGSAVNLSEWTGGDAIIVQAGATAAFTGTRANTEIVCGEGVSVTLDYVTIDNITPGFSPLTFTGENNILTVTGSNNLTASMREPGVNVSGATLRICGDGVLNAKSKDTTSSYGAPGIGSEYSQPGWVYCYRERHYQCDSGEIFQKCINWQG